MPSKYPAVFRKGSLERMQPAVVAIGVFDGLHQGHRKVVREVVHQATKRGLCPTVMTFEPLPQWVLAPKAPIFRLMPFREKLALLKQWGIAQVICLRFHLSFSLLTGEAFLAEYIQPYPIRALVVGADFRFGYQQRSTLSLLRTAMEKRDVLVTEVPLLKAHSSTAIRACLMTGDLKKATDFLGRPYSIRGRVVKGMQLAKKLGFPTANIRLRQRQTAFRGVFVAYTVVRGRRYEAVANIGIRPTLDGRHYFLEVHLLSEVGDLYGQWLEVILLRQLREEKAFHEISALQAQIAQDVFAAKRFFAQLKEEVSLEAGL